MDLYIIFNINFTKAQNFFYNFRYFIKDINDENGFSQTYLFFYNSDNSLSAMKIDKPKDSDLTKTNNDSLYNVSPRKLKKPQSPEIRRASRDKICNTSQDLNENYGSEYNASFVQKKAPNWDIITNLHYRSITDRTHSKFRLFNDLAKNSFIKTARTKDNKNKQLKSLTSTNLLIKKI